MLVESVSRRLMVAVKLDARVRTNMKVGALRI